MKSCIKKISVIAFLVFARDGYAQMAGPNATEQLQYLLSLEGKWESPVTITMGGKQEKTMYYADFSKTANGSGLLLSERVNIPGVGQSVATDLAGVDPNDGKIHWYTVDNMGTTHEHIGSWSDPQHFSMTHHSLRDGKEFMEVITLEWKKKDELMVKQTNTLGGQTAVIIEGVFHRGKG